MNAYLQATFGIGVASVIRNRSSYGATEEEESRLLAAGRRLDIDDLKLAVRQIEAMVGHRSASVQARSNRLICSSVVIFACQPILRANGFLSNDS
jgi:hypothetical protein